MNTFLPLHDFEIPPPWCLRRGKNDSRRVRTINCSWCLSSKFCQSHLQIWKIISKNTWKNYPEDHLDKYVKDPLGICRTRTGATQTQMAMFRMFMHRNQFQPTFLTDLLSQCPVWSTQWKRTPKKKQSMGVWAADKQWRPVPHAQYIWMQVVLGAVVVFCKLFQSELIVFPVCHFV